MKKIKDISLDNMIVRRQEIDATDLNGEKVMMNLDKGQYFALNEVGSRIWDIIVNPMSVKDIIHILLQEYKIDEISCKDEVVSFLGRMNDAEIIKIW